MKKTCYLLCVTVCIIGFVLTTCTASRDNYTFQISDSAGEVAVRGSFSGIDHNGDGWIEKDELTFFSEEAALRFALNVPAAWKKSFTEKTLPRIKHDLNDLESFRFELSSLKKSTPFLEYNTNTAKSIIVSGYHFWRGCQIESAKESATLINGVGDGTQGLELSMTPLENIKVEIFTK